jgi:hypothetical protein
MTWCIYIKDFNFKYAHTHTRKKWINCIVNFNYIVLFFFLLLQISENKMHKKKYTKKKGVKERKKLNSIPYIRPSTTNPISMHGNFFSCQEDISDSFFLFFNHSKILISSTPYFPLILFLHLLMNSWPSNGVRVCI